MAHYRVSESLPAELGCFDLVVIDEASQSDLTALPALLRAKKVLIVGDDKQVSPEGVGLEEQKVCRLMERFLDGQVEIYRSQMAPDRSIYDLFKVVFANSAVMLKEHFRSVTPIIEYSKREFYNHELRPLRLPKASERLDPPLVDVLVADGHREGDVNLPEARFIVNEIVAIVADPKMAGRSIGVVSLLGDKQALAIWQQLTDELTPEIIQLHRITCGDARTFQGKERDIMFLSMLSARNDVGAPLSRDTFAQRFNVAASRARDRMYLVRSVELDDLSPADKFRRSLIAHFAVPFAQDEKRIEDLRTLCESDFEREVFDELTKLGYRVTPQVKIGHYRIDLVVEGHNDARLAVECDGDQYHGPDKWADDMERQRILERAGWVFWRCFASTFTRRRKASLDDLLKTLAQQGIDPIGAEDAPRSVHTEHRVVFSSTYSEDHVGPTPSEALGIAQTSDSDAQSACSSKIDVSAQAEPQLQPPAEKEELPIREQPVVEVKENPKNDSVEHCELRQLTARFRNKPAVAPPEHPQKTHGIKPDSIPPKPVSTQIIRGQEHGKAEQFQKVPNISSSRPFTVSRPVADPFSETVMTLLPDDRKNCAACHRGMILLFGKDGPYLKCSTCDQKGQIPYQILFDTLSTLKAPCAKCGRPMSRVLPKRVFAGCSRCTHTEPWKALAVRLKEKAKEKK